MKNKNTTPPIKSKRARTKSIKPAPAVCVLAKKLAKPKSSKSFIARDTA